jgi:hypothetical protein
MKKKGQSYPKIVGAVRVGVGIERHWEWQGKSYGTKRELWETIARLENAKKAKEQAK